jgi:hypothetical protein
MDEHALPTTHNHLLFVEGKHQLKYNVIYILLKYNLYENCI